jgi:gliding motility-associated-like protein
MHTPIILPKFNINMSKRSFSLLLLLFWLGTGTLTAQNAAYSLYFEQPDSLPCTDDEFCIDLTVEDFTNILETRFNIVWDSTVVEFVGVENVITELSGAMFTQVNNGTLNVNWQENVCDDPASGNIVTLDDCGGECRPTIFTLCFRALSNYGEATDITVAETPAPYAAKDFSGCNNVFLIPKPATVSTCVRPFLLDISDSQGNEGDLVCLDFYGSGIDALTSFQFPIAWDSTLATFENVIVADNLPNLSANDFGVPGQAAGVQEGSVTVAWNGPPPTNVATIPDSTLLFQLCLRLKEGACGRDFEVVVADQQPGQPFFIPLASNDDQSVGQDGFGEIAVGHDPGEVSVGDCDPEGVKIVADCGPPVMLNDQTCVQVTAGDNFQNVNELQFLMEWNPNLLQYANVQGFALAGLNAGDFNEANTANGILGVNWDGGNETLSEGDVLFEVCFDVEGLGGNSPFRFINNDNDVAYINGDTENNIGINPSNCEVTIEQPDGVVIDITDGLEGRPGDTLCFDFAVSNFDEITDLSFSINWEPTNLEFLFPSGFQNLNADAGVTLANFGTLGWPNGFIPFEWPASGNTPVTLDDGEVLFTLCFVVPEDAEPGTCDQVLVTDDPLTAEAVSASSNGEDIGLTGINGNFCVISPDGFWLVPDQVAGDLRDTICVPFKVGELDSIADANFTVNWPPANLELTEIVDSGNIPGLGINLGGSPVGAATFDFSVADAAGLSLMDSTEIFEMCFELIGPADTCYALTVDDGAVVNTVAGAGSLLDVPGEVCINNKIFIDSVIITPETCPGIMDGTVRLIVSGGNPQILDGYGFSWENPSRVSNPAVNLPSGEVVVTVFDGIGLSVTDTIFVPTAGVDLSIDAGPDQVANCNTAIDPNFISPTVSPLSEPNLNYQWTSSGGGQIFSNPTERIGLLGGPGTFTVEVQDSNGCTALDTIVLTPPTLPDIAFVNDTPDTLTCVRDAVDLGVQELTDVTYEWAGPNGFAATTPTVMAQDSGSYTVTLTFTDTQCSATDSIRVDIDTLPPNVLANPGVDTLDLGCNDEATLVGLVDGGFISNFSVRWLDEAGTVLTDQLEYMTNIPGQYFFEATDTTTGCTNIDSVIVSPEASLPAVNIQADPPPVINCNFDPVELTTTVENTNPNGVTVEWAVDNGGALTPGTENLLSPEATTAGTYTITITENATGCTASDVVEVVFDTLPLPVSAEVVGQIDCNNETVTLDGSASASGPDITYSWFSLQFNTVVGEAAALPVGSGGNYVLTVRDTTTGCSSTDTVMVMADTLLPVINLGPGENITCDQDTVPVAVSVEGLMPGQFSASWEGDAPVAEIEGDTVARFDQPGTYTVTVTNELNGCVDTASRQINSVKFFPEIVLAEDELFINCYDNSLVIDATASTQSDTFNTVSYQWTALEGTAVPPFNENELEVEEGGIFELAITDVVSNCTVRDTAVVIGDTDPPTATLANNLNLSLSCASNVVTLDGTGSATGDDIVYVWQLLAGGTIADTIAMGPDALTVDVSTPGVYQLRVFNEANGCFGTSLQTQVLQEGGVPPQIVFGEPTDIGVIELDCTTPDTIPLSFNLANDSLFQTADLTFEWSGDAEVVTDGMDPFNVSLTGVDEAGVLSLVVTDTTSGCVGENEVVIEDIRAFPNAAIAQDSMTINCEQSSLVLDGSASTQGDTIAYEWLFDNSAAIGNADTLLAVTPGSYTLVVENTLNGCTAEDTIQVGLDVATPMAVTETPEPFQCDTESLLLSAAPTGDAADFDLVWEALPTGSNVTPNPGTLTANVDGSGSYLLTLTSNINGCDTSVVFEVMADTVAPMGMIAEPEVLGCPGQTVTLDASSFGNNGDFEIEWSTTDGGNVLPATGSLLVDVDAAGTYDLLVTSLQNGCEANATVTVQQDPNVPEAVGAAPDNMLGCGETLTLDGTGSSEGDVYDYEWIALNGGVPPVPETPFTATTMETGDYVFVVTNMETGCADTSEVVTIVQDDDLPEATAQVDSVSCDGTAFISANLPAGNTGRWESLGTATITDPMANTTTATNLAAGPNELTWTLSQDGCPDFSSTSITVVPEQAPVAQDDAATIDEGSNSVTIDLLDNDDLTGVSDFTIEITEDPSIGGLVDNGTGQFGYTLNVPLFAPAVDGFTYRLCNANCPTLCDEAAVEIEVVRDTTVDIEVANGITPNGDGVNDQLIFDDLLLAPDKYPDNSLIVFNRWGDIVFEAQPYNNDWNGVNADGSPLPDGTYYYILRLEVGSGNIIRGDITIIR